MNKNRKYGFTLVELLAVIVILAVVILIAVTAVVPRMNNAKKKAFLDETLVYMKAAKEAYVTDPSTECYNISDMGNLVKQTKDGYSGTVFVNDNGISVNISNGKYYIKTDSTPDEIDIEETLPSKYVSTCSDNTNYNITYELNGGTTSGTNPSSYTPGTGTDIFYNPTKSGYRFVGWTSKNIINFNSDKQEKFGVTAQSDNNNIKVYGENTQNSSNYGILSSNFDMNLIPGKSYVLSSDKNLGRIYFQINYFKSSSTEAALVRIDMNSKSSMVVVPSDYDRIKYSFLGVWQSATKVNDNFHIQLEEGSTATDYQNYMEPTMNAKVYKGETGNKKFVANWEAL